MGKAKIIIDEDPSLFYYHYSIYIDNVKYISGWIRNHYYRVIGKYEYFRGYGKNYHQVLLNSIELIKMNLSKMYSYIKEMYYWLDFTN